jgi:hypothetical protein
MFLKNSFYYIPKNTFTFEVGYNQVNKYFFNNPFKYTGFDYTLEVSGKHFNIFWEDSKNENIVNIQYKLTHYRNNCIHTILHINDSKNDVKEYFYVKPHAIYEDYAKIIYSLEYNKNHIYTFTFDTIYNSPYHNHKYAVFDKTDLYDKFSKKYLL